ncbi:UDP-N-acetylglucosamine pyrophosphorylase [Oceanirhabdus seepicola]|uniref:UDP-N-acetylglucosamine pyrophosphorylase n=1 Tax=Oceanirhabdus seepicola TaxID=2828781 RepID=A0A9J6P459_9CLOT|nr:UDP-N-acetylglucosamine pyrophosphorylase [Oceanirhabdus seepicola]MCM1991339.1 UDP-N-acetylglucosamine pyrophosphorylase [Oceanirhabdus seepicola]
MGISVDELFTVRELDAQAIFGGVKHPWEVLTRIKTFIFEYAKTLPNDFERIDEFVWVGKGTTIEKNVLIKGPAIIGYNCEIRHSAYIRENVIIGNDVVVGNSTEVKNSILFNKVQVPHFNYVSDSILGYKAHLGAGVITSNLKSNGTLVKVRYGTDIIETGLRKFGAILGDSAEVGCNTVLNPGTILGKGSIVYPLCSVRGYVPENSILKNRGEIVERKQR